MRTAAGTSVHQAVVLALDPGGLRQLVAASGGLGTPAWREDVAALRTAPLFLASRLWLDRPVHADRPGFLGTSGYGGLDNVSVLERYEGEAARWAARAGSSVVELYGYAVDPASDPQRVQGMLVDRLRQVYPETREARVVGARYEWRSYSARSSRSAPTNGAPPSAPPTPG